MQQDRSRHYIIAFSQCVESDNWRKTMLQGMKRELNFYPNLHFVYRQADGNSQKQISQVKELLALKPDILIISPNEADPLTPVVEEVYNNGIPVIVVDRKISSSLYTAYLGANNREVGQLAGEYIGNVLKEHGQVMEITGLPLSSPSIERDSGMVTALAKFPGIQLSSKIHGDWTREETIKSLGSLKDIPSGLDVVFAHNDVMASGAYEFFKRHQPDNHIRFIGVDAQPGTSGGMQLVSDKVLTASILYPTGGEESIQLAIRILEGEPVPRENFLSTSVVDSNNVRLLKGQSDKITSQQYDIERQQKKIDAQVQIYHNQRNYLYILSTTLIVAISLGAIAFFSLRQNRKINKKLNARNQEILEQKNKIEEMAIRTKEANEARIQFFTNISHEFRTPLTLILGPLDELLAKEKLPPALKQPVTLIHRNAVRLLRLLNQLMDFRKIEFDMMKVKASENNLVLFVTEVMDAYRDIAAKRNIDFRLFARQGECKVWFDTTMLDKILFNLLSNAFKFTKDNGAIYVTLQQEEQNVRIIVEDNGVGMTPDEVRHAFDLFYQGEHEQVKGSGLGLTLSKELMRLHHGSIEVFSQQWKGAKFVLGLPLGHTHFAPEEKVLMEAAATSYEDAGLYTVELRPEPVAPRPFTFPASKEHTLLIIEDNPDLRSFLKDKLQDNYDILEADNSNSALQSAFDTTPDLIICDVMIPGKSGVELTHLFKSDLRTSHIPVILLTAQTSIAHQLEGARNKADLYITKPFNMQLLEENIRSLIANRSLLKTHFATAGDTPQDLKTAPINRLDKKFINDLNALIELNLGNDNFNVEEICRKLGISRVQLYRKVKALLNCNVNEYILNRRLQKAKYLLKNEMEHSISEIAYKVGFSSAAYFSTVMKSKLGVTPTEFRNA